MGKCWQLLTGRFWNPPTLWHDTSVHFQSITSCLRPPSSEWKVKISLSNIWDQGSIFLHYLRLEEEKYSTFEIGKYFYWTFEIRKYFYSTFEIGKAKYSILARHFVHPALFWCHSKIQLKLKPKIVRNWNLPNFQPSLFCLSLAKLTLKWKVGGQ